jgi:hypothetical protein
MTDLDAALAASRRAFVQFAASCQSGDSAYRLTPAAEPTAYARCFGVFCAHLAAAEPTEARRATLAAAIRDAVRERRRQSGENIRGKSFRQLLTFSLSALAALGSLSDDPLEDLVVEQIPQSVALELEAYGSLSGRPGSGNQAMFTAIVLLHARDHLQCDTEERIQEWVRLHIARMNRFGFWGPDGGMTHLQFQNGYHQYEILEYLGSHNPRQRESLDAVASLVDADGHFAPYPGGGACYDYDAVFVLTPEGRIADSNTRQLLDRTARTLLAEQQANGGFAESLHVRPRTAHSLQRTVRHIASGARDIPLFAERLRYAMALQRPKHNRIHTHWSVYSRQWQEPDLWDSWFRMMTLARIQSALQPSAAPTWGFIDHPGIGYHPYLRSARPVE